MADAEGRFYSRTLLGIEIDTALAVDRDGSFGVPIPAVFGGTASGWLIANHQGSVTAILPTNTSLQLNSGWAVKYSAFGGLIGGGAGTASGIAYGFTGQRWDPHAALYSFRARWYDTQSGRMVSTDPAGLRAGDANLYRYVGNSPVSHTDPSGKFLKKLFGKIAGFFNKVIDKVFGDNLQKFIRPVFSAAITVATTVIGTILAPGLSARRGPSSVTAGQAGIRHGRPRLGRPPASNKPAPAAKPRAASSFFLPRTATPRSRLLPSGVAKPQ